MLGIWEIPGEQKIVPALEELKIIMSMYECCVGRWSEGRRARGLQGKEKNSKKRFLLLLFLITLILGVKGLLIGQFSKCFLCCGLQSLKYHLVAIDTSSSFISLWCLLVYRFS